MERNRNLFKSNIIYKLKNNKQKGHFPSWYYCSLNEISITNVLLYLWSELNVKLRKNHNQRQGVLNSNFSFIYVFLYMYSFLFVVCICIHFLLFWSVVVLMELVTKGDQISVPTFFRVCGSVCVVYTCTIRVSRRLLWLNNKMRNFTVFVKIQHVSFVCFYVYYIYILD